MSILQNKIDFAAIISCKNANPNGDPLNGNQPRKTYSGLGEISDVCIKRKIRNRLMDMGEEIFVRPEERSGDGFGSLRQRADKNMILKEAEKQKNKELYAKAACESWTDVRSFGQVFAYKGDKSDGLSVGVRGPVSVQPAFSVETVDISSIQITKSVKGDTADKGKKGADTMCMKHRVEFGVYLLKGSINVQLAEKTGFTVEDGEKIKEALRTLFINDSSSARPEGSMNVEKLYWWRHNNKIGQYSAAKVHSSLVVELMEGKENTDITDYRIERLPLAGLECEVYEGI